MAEGINIWDASGNLTMDANTMTGRVIGSRVATSPYHEVINVPVSAGKTLWWHFYTDGNVWAQCYQSGGPNQFTIQIDPPSYWQGQTGSVYLFYGEY